MFVGKTLLDYTNLFSTNDCKKNDKIIYKYFKYKYSRKSKPRVKFKKNWWNKKLSMQYVKWVKWCNWVKNIKRNISI